VQDGVALNANDRILTPAQTNPLENDIWVVSAGAWSRSGDTKSRQELNGASVRVTAGTVNANTIWYQTTYAPIPGTTAQTWSKTNDVVLNPVTGIRNQAGQVPAPNDLCVIKEPLAAIALRTFAQQPSLADNYLFCEFPTHTTSRQQAGAFLINVKLTTGPALLTTNSCLTMFGVELDANVTLTTRERSSVYMGVTAFDTIWAGSWQNTVLGITDNLQWYGWGVSAPRVGALSAPIGFSQTFGFANLNFYAQGTGSDASSYFLGGRWSGGMQCKQGSLVLQNTKHVDFGFGASDNGRLTCFENIANLSSAGDSIVVSHCNDDVMGAGDSGQIFLRTGSLSGHSTLGHAFNIGVPSFGGFAGGGKISSQGTQTVSGSAGWLHTNSRGDFAESYFNLMGKGVIDNAPPNETGGMWRRTA
jgi:hypothetical protein